MRNPYARLRALLPDKPLQIGLVLSVDGGIANLELPGGGLVTARGDVQPGDRVFFRDGAIEGPAPNLPVEVVFI